VQLTAAFLALAPHGAVRRRKVMNTGQTQTTASEACMASNTAYGTSP
jgi:hypothetical protein